MAISETTTLTKSQAARRQRVIDAALELGAEGGYDAVQMRDVAARANVALGTIYRYFSSKDHLLSSAQVEWVRELERRVDQRPPKGDTIAARVVDILRRAARGLEQNPLLSAAFVAAMSSNDRDAAVVQFEVSRITTDLMERAFPADFDPRTRTDIVRMLGHVWFSSLVAWVNGGWGGGPIDLGQELEIAAHLMCDPYES